MSKNSQISKIVAKYTKLFATDMTLYTSFLNSFMVESVFTMQTEKHVQHSDFSALSAGIEQLIDCIFIEGLYRIHIKCIG